MDIYKHSPLGKAEQLYNAAEREDLITAKLTEEVRAAGKIRKLSRNRMAEDLGLGTSTFNHIVRGQYSARTDDHVRRILRYTGCTEQEIVDVLNPTPISFREIAANDPEIMDGMIGEVTDEEVERIFGDVDQIEVELHMGDGDQIEAELQAHRDRKEVRRILSAAEEQAAIRELRKEDHTVYAPVHLGSWLQLQMDLLEEIPHAHLNAFVYKCITRMSDIERYKIKRIIDDLRGEETDD